MVRSGVRAGALAVLAAVTLVSSACGASRTETGGGSPGAAEDSAISGLTIMAANAAGSGYDTTARAAARAMEAAGLTETVSVTNVSGAGGTVALAQLGNEAGNGDLLMQMGFGVVGAEYTNNSSVRLADTTPIARLLQEAEAVAVPAASPYQTLDDLITAWQADPAGVVVGGASNPGGPDHLTPMLMAKAVGTDPKTVNYVAYDGGGELLAGLLGEKVAFGVTGVNEVIEQADAGEVRILAVSSTEPVEGVDAPTLQEAGVDVNFVNWRGVVAPPELEEADRERLITLLENMHESEEWQQALEENGWTDAFLTGEEFETFLDAETQRVETTLTELGLGA
jgi:putative tricarboxylic transport membrane protein